MLKILFPHIKLRSDKKLSGNFIGVPLAEVSPERFLLGKRIRLISTPLRLPCPPRVINSVRDFNPQIDKKPPDPGPQLTLFEWRVDVLVIKYRFGPFSDLIVPRSILTCSFYNCQNLNTLYFHGIRM